MTISRNRLVQSSLLIAVLICSCVTVSASERLDTDKAQAIVQPFYDFLSGKVDANRGFANMSSDWRSFSSDTAFKNIEQTSASIAGLRQHVVPDLSWAIHDVIVNEDYVVIRGEGSGTPVTDFLGVPASGNQFSIMSIDIHRVVNGAVVSTWHVENWAEAIQQLSAK